MVVMETKDCDTHMTSQQSEGENRKISVQGLSCVVNIQASLDYLSSHPNRKSKTKTKKEKN